MSEQYETTITIRLEMDLRDALAELAGAGDRTFSQEVRRALRLYVLAAEGKRVTIEEAQRRVLDAARIRPGDKP